MEGHKPRAHRPGIVPVFALGDVEFRMPGPITDRPLIADGQRGNVIISSSFGDPPAALANDDRDLALVIQFMAFRRPDQRPVMAGETAGKAWKQRHVFGRVRAVFIFSIAVGKIDPNTQNPRRVGQHHFEKIVRMRDGLAISCLCQRG